VVLLPVRHPSFYTPSCISRVMQSYEHQAREAVYNLDLYLQAVLKRYAKKAVGDPNVDITLFKLYEEIRSVARGADLEVRGLQSLLQNDIMLSPFVLQRQPANTGVGDDSDEVVPGTPQPSSPSPMIASPITPTQRVHRHHGVVHLASPQGLHRVVSRRAPITVEDASPSQTQPVVITTQSQPKTSPLPTPLSPTHRHLLLHVTDNMEDSPPLFPREAPRASLVRPFQSHQRGQAASRPPASPRALSFASLKRR
jgi:hypothetical protein